MSDPYPLLTRSAMRLLAALVLLSLLGGPAAAWEKLKDFPKIGRDPVSLGDAWVHRPAAAGPDRPLVVVLHGCLQTPQDYQRYSGWVETAERHGFALLMPSYQGLGKCFPWSDDAQAEQMAQALERAMVAARAQMGMTAGTGKTFVAGLSAGAAMAAVLAAHSPDIEGAAIFAGLAVGAAQVNHSSFSMNPAAIMLCPYPIGSTLLKACRVMNWGVDASTEELADAARAMAPGRTVWPRVLIWQGDADITVVPANSEALLRQWTALHGLTAVSGQEVYAQGNRVVVERRILPGFPHAWAVDDAYAGGCGKSGGNTYIKNDGLCAAEATVQFWGLAD